MPVTESDHAKPPAYVLPEEYVTSPERFFMEWLPQAVAAYPEVGRRFGSTRATAQFELDGGLEGDAGGVWHLALGGDELRAHRGAHPAPTFTLRMSLDLWRRLQRGEANGVAAFLKGEIRLRGSWFHFLRLARKFG